MKAAVLNTIPASSRSTTSRSTTPAPRGAGPHRRRRPLPQRPPLHGGQYPYRTPAVLGHESAGIVEAVGDQVTYVQARRPRHHLPVGVLRPLRARASPATSSPVPAARTCAAAPSDSSRASRATASPVHPVRSTWARFAEQMLVHEHAVVKIRDGHAARPRARSSAAASPPASARCSTPPRSSPAPPSRSSAAAASASTAIQGAAHRRRRPGHRGRHARRRSSSWPAVRRHRHRRRRREGDPVGQVQEITDGGGVHYASRPSASSRPPSRPSACCARRHGHDHRHDPGRPEDRAARLDVPGREEAPGLEHGLEPLPRRHAALHRPLPRRPAEARRDGIGRVGTSTRSTTATTR